MPMGCSGIISRQSLNTHIELQVWACKRKRIDLRLVHIVPFPSSALISPSYGQCCVYQINSSSNPDPFILISIYLHLSFLPQRFMSGT